MCAGNGGHLYYISINHSIICPAGVPQSRTLQVYFPAAPNLSEIPAIKKNIPQNQSKENSAAFPALLGDLTYRSERRGGGCFTQGRSVCVGKPGRTHKYAD